MAWCDFAVPYDRFKDTQEEVTQRIVNTLVIKRLAHKKPTVIFMSGDSGEGKSWAVLRFMEILCKLKGIRLEDVLHDMNVYTPIEYPQKLKKILYPKEHFKEPEKIKVMKKAHILAVHESRTLIKSKNWHDFTTQAIADVNAMSRSIKRLCFMIVSQFIRDITTDVRYTLTYYLKASRPLGQKTRVYWHVMWKDDRDLEKPKLRKRMLSGYLKSPSGKYKHILPTYFEMSKPAKEITDEFERVEFEAKGKIIHSIMEKLVKKMEMEANVGNKKVDAMVKWYSSEKNHENLPLIGKTNRLGNWKFRADVKNVHDLTETEFQEFETKMNEKLKKHVEDVD